MFRLMFSRRFFLLLLACAWPGSAFSDITRPKTQPIQTEAAAPRHVTPLPVTAAEVAPDTAPAADPVPTPALPAPAPSASPDEAFARALVAYKAGAIEDARREFLAIVEAGRLSAALAHNLGNIEYRRGNPGQAVLWYKRALVLKPFSPETLQNLRTIRRQSAFLTFDPWGLSLAHLKPHWVANGTILAAWTIGLLVVWLVWSTPRPGRRWPLITLLLLALPVLGTGAALTWWQKNDPHPLTKRQVVSGKETMAYAAPAEASSSVIALPAGSEVVPLETRGNWLYCIIPGGEGDQPLRGWIRSAKLEALWPYGGGGVLPPDV